MSVGVIPSSITWLSISVVSRTGWFVDSPSVVLNVVAESLLTPEISTSSNRPSEALGSAGFIATFIALEIFLFALLLWLWRAPSLPRSVAISPEVNVQPAKDSDSPRSAQQRKRHRRRRRGHRRRAQVSDDADEKNLPH